MKANFLQFALAANLLITSPLLLSAQSWSTIGNTGTNASTNFLGTKDNKAFSLRTNNIERMRVTSTGSFGFGTSVPHGKVNIDNGNILSLTASGYFVIGNVSSFNIGFDNTQMQARINQKAASLYLNYLGGTTFIGSSTKSSTGMVANGTQYGLSGYGATGVNGVSQTSNGFGVAGSGYYGMYGYSSTDYGYGVYGHGAATSAYGVEGYSVYSIGVYGATGTSSSYAGFFVGDVYTTGSYQSSDEKLKQNIQDFPSAMNIINQLHPKQYQYRQDGDFKQMNLPQGEHYGLIAQDVEKVLPALVKNSKFDVMKSAAHTIAANSNDSNSTTTSIMTKTGETVDFKALNYTELIPIIIKGMQEQQQTIQALQNKNDQLQAQVNQLQQMITGNTSTAKANTNFSSAYLLQNAPNPFNQNTTVSCYVPSSVKQAQIVVYNNAGQLVKTFSLNNGNNNIVISAGTLPSGQYAYSLLIDGKKADTKNMMLTK